MKRPMRRFAVIALIIIATVLSAWPLHARWPVALGGEELPTLAPLLGEVAPGVENLGTRGRVRATGYDRPILSAHLDQPARQELPTTEAIIEHDFARNGPSYIVTRTDYSDRLKQLTAQLVALQKQGKGMACSEQILIEARWLLEHTTAWTRLDAQLGKLGESLQNTDQNFATRQSPRDGAWGLCYDEWFLKLDATIDALNLLADHGKAIDYPLVFLQRIGSPDSLVTYLKGLLVSDIAETGIDQRDELGAVTGALSQMLFKPWLRRFIEENVQGFVITGAYIDAYQSFLDSWQDPSTGYWGAWYRSDGRLYKSADLSLTFHTISYRHGNVKYWTEIVDTTFAIKHFEYPYGWMHNGAYNHHNNYDVVKILRYGWPHMSDAQRERARSELKAMLRWCLTGPMQSDELFAVDPTFYSSPANYFYYGVSFLDEIGYLDKSRRFWTDQDFPDATSLCQTIKARLTSLNLDSPPAEAAMKKLEANCPAT